MRVLQALEQCPEAGPSKRVAGDSSASSSDGARLAVGEAPERCEHGTKPPLDLSVVTVQERLWPDGYSLGVARSISPFTTTRVLGSEYRERISQRSVGDLHEPAKRTIEIEDQKHRPSDRKGTDQ